MVAPKSQAQGRIPKNSGGGAGTPEQGEWLNKPGQAYSGIHVPKEDLAGHKRTAAGAKALVRAEMILIRGEKPPVLVVETRPDMYFVRRADGNLIKILTVGDGG